MKSLIILIFFLFNILQFYSNFVEANEEFKFIVAQFKICKNLENERRNFEAMKNNAEYGWDKIEPENELKKCIINFNISTFLYEIKNEFMCRHSRILNCKKEVPSNASEDLRKFSTELEKLHLKKELMEMLRAKIGDGIQDKGIIQSTDSEEEDGSPPHGSEESPFSNPFLAEFNRQIDELINKNNIGGSSKSHHGGIENLGQIKATDQQIQAEMNNGRVQILQSIYDFRKKLNTEIKWLNMMLWLKKSKAYMKWFGHRLANENEQKMMELGNFFKSKFKATTSSIWKDWKKESKFLSKELEKIIKESDSLKSKTAAGNSAHDGRSDWPHYDELLAKTTKINFMIKLDLKKDRCSMNKKEDKQINKLLIFGEKWDKAVDENRSKINGFVEEHPQYKKEYEKIFYCVALHRATSMAFQLLMGIFEWENVEWKMAAIRHLVDKYMKPYILNLAETKKQGRQMNQLILAFDNIFSMQEWKTTNPLNLIGNSKLMDDNQMLIGSRDIRIQVVIDALRVLTFYEKINGKIIVETNYAKKMEEFKKEIDMLIKTKLPEDRLEMEYWKWYKKKRTTIH